jgi:hypothetical protein
LTLALDAVLHPALFTTAFFAGAFFAAFLIYTRDPLMGHGPTKLIQFLISHYRNHAISANQENSQSEFLPTRE